MRPTICVQMTNELICVSAGVVGLTTALLLVRNPKNKVTIVAKHMPGDYDIEYASPWAGANYLPYVTCDESQAMMWINPRLPSISTAYHGRHASCTFPTVA
jgi:glycine/D-amino acid oxidase-like deaminating enzyme